jgi:hypothetical protein
VGRNGGGSTHANISIEIKGGIVQFQLPLETLLEVITGANTRAALWLADYIPAFPPGDDTPPLSQPRQPRSF